MKKPLILEQNIFTKALKENNKQSLFESYLASIRAKDKDNEENELMNTRVDFTSENLILNETTQSLLDSLSDKLEQIDGEDNIIF